MPDIKTTFTLAAKYEKRAMQEFDRDLQKVKRSTQEVEREFKRATRSAKDFAYGEVRGGGSGGSVGGGRGRRPSPQAMQQSLELYTGEAQRKLQVAQREARQMRVAGVSQNAIATATRGGQMMAQTAGSMGGAGGFFGETAAGGIGAVGGGVAQGAGVLAAGGTLGAAATAAAVAIPVALVAVGAAAAAKLTASSFSLLKSLEPGRRGIVQAGGSYTAAESAAAAMGFRPSVGLQMGQELAGVGITSPSALRRAMQVQTAFGVGAGEQAGMLGTFRRRAVGGSPEQQLRMTIAAGMTQALERGRLDELFGVMSSMAEGRAPGMRPMDQTTLATFLGAAGAPGFEQFRGAGGQFAAQQLQNFMTQSGMGQAVGMTAAGLGRGSNFFDAFQTMQAGPFGQNGVNPQQFVNQFARMAMGQNFGQLSGQKQQTLAFMFGQQQGIPMESAMKILQMGAMGDAQGFNKAMEESTKTVQDKTLDVLESGMMRFEGLASQWERYLQEFGEKLAPVLFDVLPILIEKLAAWTDMLPDMRDHDAARAVIKGATDAAIPDPSIGRFLGGQLLPGPFGGMAGQWIQNRFGDARDNGDTRNAMDNDGAIGAVKRRR